MATIRFYRDSFPNNSSSSHSFLLLGDAGGLRLRDKLGGGSYQWEDFIVWSPEAKRDYLLAVLLETCRYLVSHDMKEVHRTHGLPEPVVVGFENREKAADQLYRSLLGRLPQEFQDAARDMPVTLGDMGVDHQSLWLLPISRDSLMRVIAGDSLQLEPDLRFLVDLHADMSGPGIVILGGNDNEAKPKRLRSIEDRAHGTYNVLAYLQGRLAHLSSFDEGTSEYVLYSKMAGTEMRVSLAGEEAQPGTRGSFPTLVDMSIGNWCDRGCSFCYTGSTTAGRWAPVGHVLSQAREMHAKGTNHFVLGGGEPTKHPGLPAILEGMPRAATLSLTTRNYQWDPPDSVRGRLDSVAISVSTERDLQDSQALASRLEGLGVHVTLQTIAAGIDGARVRELVDELIRLHPQGHRRPSLTLLGWKPVGRAAALPPPSVPDWVPAVLPYVRDHLLAVSIDSPLAETSQAALMASGVVPCTVEPAEGLYSCYVDVLRGTMAYSSYGGTSAPFPEDAVEILPVFRSLRPA